MKRTTKIILLAIIALGTTAGIIVGCGASEDTMAIDTANAEKGSISQTVTATGTIEAITTVEVGTQVSGVIKKLYADFNSVVKKGQLLATLDETMLRATLDQSRATLMEAEATLTFQKANYQRMKILYDKNLIAQADFDQVDYNYKQAMASIANAKASLRRNQVNLDYATIYSPIDGVILNRAVDEGQTVAASFNTPTLFTIANDLTRMQVQADVDEADIGQIRINQRVEFTVDAFTGETFAGTVTEVRLQPVVTSNVVTYTVIVNAPNPEKKLMPGMTASIVIYMAEAKNVVTIPVKALKFEPTAVNSTEQVLTTEKAGKGTHVWVYDGTKMHPRNIETGLSDGSHIEVKTGLKPGEEVVLAVEAVVKSDETQKTVSSPFVPKRPGSSKNKPPQP